VGIALRCAAYAGSGVDAQNRSFRLRLDRVIAAGVLTGSFTSNYAIGLDLMLRWIR
jgi:hypothetical protein